MKLSTAAFFLFTLPRAIARPDEESASAPFVQRELAISHDGLDTKGRILLTMNHRDLGKVDVSSLESAQAAAKAFLEGTNDHGRRLGPFPNNGDKFNPKNKDPNHMRFVQEHNGMEIEGASIMVHTDANGNIVGINGEFVSTSKVSANR
jgi:Zn-dependent metalloprotease